VVEETLARRQQRHATRRPDEQCGAELVLERTDLSAERRLRDVETLSRAADVAFLGHGNEVTDLGEAHARSMFCAACSCKRRRPDRNGIGHLRSPAGMQERS